MSGFDSIERRIGDYYAGKLAEHGATPSGVDWNSENSQRLRFAQLLKIVDVPGPFSLNDYGCGYGALIDHLRAEDAPFSYRGFDVAEAMVAEARRRHGDRFTANFSDLPVADYTVASGIFNVLAGADREGWLDYIRHTVRQMASVSRRGLAFNCLTSYSDPERMTDRLYYADPAVLFDFCKRELSRNVALLHDYELYEFTVLVRLPAGPEA